MKAYFMTMSVMLLAAAAAMLSAPVRPLRFLVVAPIPASNSPALDLMGVASQLKARGHAVMVVAPSHTALPYLQRAAARHSSNTTAEAMVWVAAAAAAHAAESDRPSAAAAAAASASNTKAVPQSEQQKQKQQPPQHAEQHIKPPMLQQTWKVPESWLGQVLLGSSLIAKMFDAMGARCADLMDDAALVKTMRDFQPDAILPIVLLPTGPLLAVDSCGCVLSDLLGGVPYIEVDAALATFWLGPPSMPQFGAGLLASDLHHLWKRPGPWIKNAAAWTITQSLSLRAALNSDETNPQAYAGIRAAHQLPPVRSYSSIGNLWRAAVAFANKWRHGTSSSKSSSSSSSSWQGRGPVHRCQALLQILPSSKLLEYPHSLAPHQVLVGPGSPRLPQRLMAPQQVVDFVEEATHGLVLVGFGTGKVSNDSAWLRPDDFVQLAQGFADLAPVRVLWNLQAGLPEGVEQSVLGSNTLVVGWIDYNDVLGHPHTRAFVSHCGLHSALEAMFHGVPLVGLPFMFEQLHTCNKLVWRGAAAVSRQSPTFRTGQQQQLTFTPQHIADLVTQVLHNSSSASAASQISAALQAYSRHRHPYARAADEIELALAAAALMGSQQARAQHADEWGRQQQCSSSGS